MGSKTDKKKTKAIPLLDDDEFISRFDSNNHELDLDKIFLRSNTNIERKTEF